MAWTSALDTMQGGRVRRIAVLNDGEPVSYGDVIDLWRHDDGFRDFFIALLAGAPFDAYLWETPAVTRTALNRAFECILAESDALARMRPDPHTFAAYFKADDSASGVVSFRNLGGDALLVAPRPRTSADSFPHLAAFARTAPGEQQHAFWSEVGRRLAETLSERPLWLSTNGLGVAWLHDRVDTRPKYYSFQPYRVV